MIGKFTFNGVASDSFDNIKIDYQTLPFLPRRRTKTEYVIGKDGGYIFEDDYENIEVQVIIYIHNNNALTRRRQLSNMATWLNGSGKLKLEIESDVEYDASVNARVISNVNYFEDKMEVMFECKPIKKVIYDNDEVTWESAEYEWQLAELYWAGGNTSYEDVADTDVLNPINFGNYKTHPVIEISGAATSLSLTDDNENTLTFSTLVVGDGTIYIDCENKLVYTESGGVKTNQISRFSGDFIYLNPGENTIDVSATGESGLDIKFDYRNAFL